MHVVVDCVVDATVCISHPCLNGGMCNVTADVFKCTCPRGFIGPMCEYGLIVLGIMMLSDNFFCKVFLIAVLDVGRCRSQPCQNDGTCHSKLNDYVCICADGYKGELCEEGGVFWTV